MTRASSTSSTTEPARPRRAIGRVGAALAASLVTAAAGPAAAQPAVDAPVDRVVQGIWRIEQARVEPVYDRARARLHFNADGLLVGHTGCNALEARYTLQGDRLALGPVTIAQARCGRLQMEQEDRILTALEVAATARVRDDGLLELRDADGRGVLRATRWSSAN